VKQRVLAVLALVVGVASASAAEVDDLIKKLKSADSDERRAAAKDLADLGKDAKPAVPALQAALKDRDTYVRRFSAQALGAIGPDAAPAVPALAKALNDPRKEVGEAAAVALGKIGPSSASALVSALKTPPTEPVVRKRMVEALGQMGSAGRQAVPTLSKMLLGKVKRPKKKDKFGNDEDVRLEIAMALGELATADDKVAIDALQALNNKKQRNRELRKAVMAALRKIQSRKSAE
jgi:HEAT repeat protein